MYLFCLKVKRPTMLYEDIKVICKICLLIQELVRYFILAPCYNLTLTMEFAFSFPPSYFSVIFLAKGKISKSGAYSFILALGQVFVCLECFKTINFLYLQDTEMESSKKHCSFSVNWHFILRSSRLSVCLCLSVHLSRNFLKIGSLVFSDIVHDDIDS